MKVVLLGTGVGTSGLDGIPDRFPPGVLVESQGELLLFDCSEGIRFRIAKAGYEFTSIHHIAISHPHADHNVLQPFLLAVFLRGKLGGEKYKNESISIYSSREINTLLKAEQKTNWKDYSHAYPKLRFVPMRDGESRKVGKNILIARTVYHQEGKLDARAFRLETPGGIFVYSGDTGWCRGIREIAKGADIFICEASTDLGKEEYKGGWGHLSAYQAGEIARDAKAKLLILTHYTGADSDKTLIQACKKAGFKGKALVGKDFQQFTP